MYQLALVAVILCILFKVLNVNNTPAKSIFFCANKKFQEEILKLAPSLSEPYVPTRLWGFSGHVQTIIQGALSRVYCPLVRGRRYFFIQKDHTTVTYDLYQPETKEQHSCDYTLAVCPGICNTSESVYIRRFVHEAQNHGYRVAVLNHVGALKSVPITSPRIFNYGNTKDYGGMIADLMKRYPGTKFVCIGFSMGGNIVTKFLGEEDEHLLSKVISGISACQGYDAVTASQLLLQWENFRRFYFFAMTENMRGILRRWQKQLFGEELKREKKINEREVWSAATLVEIDEAYTRKIWGCGTLDSYYKTSSSINYVDNIKVPTIFINATDDPIVPPPLVEKIKKKIEKHNNMMHIEQRFGGHLGFYEGGFVMPSSVTWLDRVAVNITDALVSLAETGKDKVTFEEEGETGEAMMEELTPFGSDEESSPDEEDTSESSGISSDDSSPLMTKRSVQYPTTRPRFVCKRKTIQVSSLRGRVPKKVTNAI